MIPLVTFWLSYIALPILLWTVARRLGNRPAAASTDADATRCGRCGYDVRELPTDVCPECGSDLNVVGRVTESAAARQRWRRRWLPAAGLAVMMISGFACTVAALFDFSPRRQVGRSINPMVCFDGNKELPWPFLIIIDSRWDRDESPRVFGTWFRRQQQIVYLSSAFKGPASTQPSTLAADADQLLTWDAGNDRWMYKSPGHANESGRGFPPAVELQRWANDVCERRPPATAPTENEITALAVAGGNEMAMTNGLAKVKEWQSERVALLSGASRNTTPFVMASRGGTFRNSIIPFWPPTALVAIEWIVIALLCAKALRRNRSIVSV